MTSTGMAYKLIKQYVSSYVFQPKPEVFVVFLKSTNRDFTNMFDLEARKYLWFSGGGKAWSVCLLAQQEVTLSTTTTTTLHIYYYFYHYKFTVY
jgi:hypothetical protein